MNLDDFVAGSVGFAQSLKAGVARQLNPSEPVTAGAGLPMWPVFALRQAVDNVDPKAVALEAQRAIEAAIPLVRASGVALQTVATIGGVLVPVAAAIGPAVAPALSGVPAVGPALGVAATAAGPIVAAGSVVAGAAGGLASGAPDPKALSQLGQQVADQLNQLEKTSTADVVIDQSASK